MQVHTYQEEAFPETLKLQAISFMRVEWPFIFHGADRYTSDPYPSSLNPTHFAVVEQGVLLSYATLLRMEKQHLHETYTIYGFGNVFTFPPYRREGHGGRVVRAASTYIQSSDADIGMLFCSPEQMPFYAQCGWELISSAETRIGTPTDFEIDSSSRMVLFVSAKSHRNRDAFMSQPMYLDTPW